MGQVHLTGQTTLAMLADFGVKGGCPDGVLRVGQGGQGAAARIQVVADPARGCDASLFYRNGFEAQQ